ncbi:TlpA family protein disulfide reductase [Sphingobacterium olei]|uniref:TlpA family protein disulfide reductase n=1 Tax=Sphingobacterium olei TaxID=2571155 RepID=A0A4U0P3W1_9SPHI|nr:TlpA disulfide reductase family protein [Sphingobacterium olei]TJZ61983.1 TlpA family protein disulfide reductase [Sphingobacterium olei]
MRKLRKGERYALFSNTKDNILEGRESFNIKEVPNTRQLKESLATKSNGKKEMERKHKRGICKPKYGVSNFVSRIGKRVNRICSWNSVISNYKSGIWVFKNVACKPKCRKSKRKHGIREHVSDIRNCELRKSKRIPGESNDKKAQVPTKLVPSRDFVRYSFAICLVFLCLFSAYPLPFLCLLFGISLLILCLYAKGSTDNKAILTIGTSQLGEEQSRDNTLPDTYQVRPAFDRHGFSTASRRLRAPMAIGARSDNDQSAKPEMQNKGGRKEDARQNLVRTKLKKNTVYLWSTYQKATVSIRVTYQKYTLDLLKTYQRLTKKLPTRYQEASTKLVSPYREATGKVQAFSSSTVVLSWRSGMLLSKGSAICCVFILCFHVLFSDVQAQSAGERAVEGPPTEYQGRVLSDAAFTPIEGAKIERLTSKTRELVFSDTAGYFVIPPHWGDDSIRVSFHSFGAVTKALYDGKLIRGKSTVFLKKDTSFIDKPFLGDSIPDSIWELPLQVVNEKSGRRIVTLREYQHKDLIVLDFWATWCSPCVKALDHWNELQQDYGQQLMVLPVHNSNHTKVAAFIKNRGWDMPCVVGENYFILQSHFFKRPVVGNPIFIYKGRYLACPSVRGYDDAAIRGILEGRPVDIVNRFEATHMEGLEGRR